MRIRFFKKKKNNRIEEIIVDENHEIEQDEREMIRGVFGLGETAVRAIMVPRTDVVALSTNEAFSDILKTVIKSGHSRFPVYQDTIDNILGFLHVKDLLPFLAKGEELKDIQKLLRSVRFVPEGKMIDELLKELQQKREHIAVVVDEYGGTAGIVCLEDILEEIVGEIQDEYDNEEEEIREISPHIFICDARIPLNEINEELGIDLPLTGSDTLGGFVFDLLGKIPDVNEKISYEDIGFKVVKIEGHRIKKVQVSIAKNIDEEKSEKK